jgi:hypothetical protein
MHLDLISMVPTATVGQNFDKKTRRRRRRRM